MAPAYDEFEEKDRRRRSLSDSVISLPRIRRNRRTTACIAAVIVLGLYYLLHSVTYHWEPPLDPFDDHDGFAPYYQYNPVLGAAENPESTIVVPKIRFPYLYSSLSTSSAAGLRAWNRNVLYVAADIKAAGRLAVTACEMSKHRRVDVHFALLGDSSTKVEDFQNLSGLGRDGDCRVTFHDGTTIALLTKPLLGKAVKYAMMHMHRFLHPQVMFIDKQNENEVVLRAIKEAATQYGAPIIELPENAAENLRWMTRLSSQSLQAWNRPKVEIFIRCDKHHGNLERLLRSLQNADYFGIKPSRLTIEVGSAGPLHPFTQEFIENFEWPSRDRVGVRYPIFPPKTDSVSQALHHVQSFYPMDKDTNILFLDPNVEVSPYYFHWLHYATLEYIYSNYPYRAEDELYGISLTTPQAFINGTMPFDAKLTEPGPYLYAAPSTEASLFFAKPWKQFFSYFQWRMQAILERKNPSQGVTHPSAKDSNKSPMTIKNEAKTSTVSASTNANIKPHPLSGAKKQYEEEELLLGATIVDRRSEPTLPPPLPIERNFTLPSNVSLAFASSWLLYFAEFAHMQGGLMLYPNFGSSDDSEALAICHSEIPSKAIYKLSPANPSRPEQKLIQSMASLDSLPGWNLPVWLQHPIRNMAGEATTENELEVDARAYQSQVSNNCSDDTVNMQDISPVADILCKFRSD